MSVRSELEELVRWISDLSEEQKAEPPPDPLPRESWQAVGRNLNSAAETFAKAHRALVTQHGGTGLSEFARDVAREAEALALRAHLLSRRAKPEPPAPRTDLAQAPAPKPKDAEKHDGAAKASKAPEIPKEDRPDKEQRSAAELAAVAQRTVETAHEKLGPLKDQDPATKAFAQGLDVLAEMTLHLRQQSEQLDEAKEQTRQPEKQQEES